MLILLYVYTRARARARARACVCVCVCACVNIFLNKYNSTVRGIFESFHLKKRKLSKKRLQARFRKCLLKR